MSHDLNETLIFVKVVEQGSFIAAAKSLGLPKTTVSRKVQELETRLGARLLHRTTRRLGLTEAGSIYHEHCQRIARELEEAESAVSQLQSGPRGWLRFTVPYSIGITWIAPLLGQFHAQYPEIRLDMHMGNEKLDLIAGEADLALRVGALPDSNLVARKLGSLRTQVFASPAYIERYGEPLHPEELQFHRILAMRKPYHTGNSPRFTWQLGENGGELRDFPVTPLMTANDMSALNGALVCGEGLLLTGDVMAKPFVESGMVRRVLAGWTGPEVDFNAVFAGGRLVSPKVRAFVDFLVEKLNFDANYMLAQCPGAKLAQQQKEKEDAALESSGKRILEKVAASSA
ncbi:LysR family transcriptional regulator [Stenotrophomonas maltophilia]|uniref:LysR family transcriptional regulator n=1 Tax=Stenotrophomonas maltophilia TaxID=40324 RepID=UPI000B4CE600|nr:LysR family transcriptional regulator [Stenotrophomonas maltophilia]OWQ66183.1 LysR family transcriptional regulator [Stenotrophomonas maltophilia]QGL67433.1 LysR family transcriptional regulator [Stenotrophomonas maltophilia]